MTELIKYLDRFYIGNKELDERVSIVTQEHDQVMEAYKKMLNGDNTASELAQELLDLITASLNTLKKMDSEELVTIGTEVFKHSIKMNYEEQKNE